LSCACLFLSIKAFPPTKAAPARAPNLPYLPALLRAFLKEFAVKNDIFLAKSYSFPIKISNFAHEK
jgi:hypothetical protein